MTQQETIRLRRFGPLDAVLITAIIVTSIAFIPAMRVSGPSLVIIKKDNTILAKYPLDKSISCIVTGTQGDLMVCIQNGTVFIQKSSCKNQVCVQTGSISKPFQQIICAPNHVSIEILSNHANNAIDAIAQ